MHKEAAIKTKTLTDIGEFGFIKILERENRVFFNKVIKGIGDDCAVIEKDKEDVFLISTELFVEDIHFLKQKIPPYKLGIKVVNASLSDIAAMGGRPLYLFTSISLPSDTELDYLDTLYKGIKDACLKYKVDIIGGDTSSSVHRTVINITVIGEMKREEVVYRSGARPEDLIYVTGYLGDSSIGLMLLKDEISIPEELRKYFIKAHTLPEPDINIGRLVASHRYASAMIDISDGLVADLNHICESSKVGAEIFLDKIPVSKQLISIKEKLPSPIYEYALYGGEDYKLIIVIRSEKKCEFESLVKKNGLVCYLIGKITEEKGIKAVSDKESTKLEIRGYVHF